MHEGHRCHSQGGNRPRLRYNGGGGAPVARFRTINAPGYTSRGPLCASAAWAAAKRATGTRNGEQLT